ncbi:bifunctional phosphopantothenoylcysteine decarboxylase/phosphopantothenate--cysteine ligase CoaBC [Carnobacterium gallinarum]|uniref:bifunctional phosphopantothenoylcysteine decarboxylase/phosphopantothenate--cysteine ligase CoaBC n=1 Tax=Carnobacterium gallinarum TaxID=2749 RepID=UPI00054D368C|nr:bifunctional phosphopantothenoylcysteine decarboxylase/phosphopantothenate--cysteine ligase CoaBC [Carnobacterium gallinarum]
MLAGKKVALYVTGGIAVYKVCDLTRKLIKAGAEVKVAMTESATQFVAPLTFQVLSKNDVYLDTFDEKISSEVAHIHLADWSDLAIIAPATANSIAKLANGIADDFVSTALLATTAPIYIVPAMNQHMLENPATVRNLKTIALDGRRVIEPATGFLAEGYEGRGRLPEPADIITEIELDLTQRQADLPLKGRKMIVTAGGTKERIDPVRFITNDSSGKMGYSLAIAARDLGAEVYLISASQLLPNPVGITVIPVETSSEMETAILTEFDTTDIVIMAAAVSDYKPANEVKEKIKKSDAKMTIELLKTTDILAELGQKKKQQFLVGFAAETTNIATYAMGKLEKKKADMIVANDVSQPHAGFNKDTNEVTIYSKLAEPIALSVRSKAEIAKGILAVVLEQLNRKN